MVVGDHQQGGLGVPRFLLQQGKGTGCVGGVEIAGGLVCQQQARGGQQGASDGTTLFFALGQGPWLGGELRGDAEAFGELFKALVDSGCETQGWIEAVGQQDVFAKVEVVEQSEVLEDETDMLDAEGATPCVWPSGGVVAVELDATFLRSVDAGEKTEEGGLARSAGAGEGDVLARLDFEVRWGETECATGIAKVHCVQPKVHGL